MEAEKSAVVCVLSTPPPQEFEEEYRFFLYSEELAFKGTRTNDAPIKALLQEAHLRGHSVATIFCLTSPEALEGIGHLEDETKQYKKDVLKEDGDLPIERIDYDMGDPEASLAELITKLDPSYRNVYFDITGGGRDASILMVLAVQFLKMREPPVEIPDIVYSNRNEHRIISQLESFELSKLRSAVEAFSNYGKADNLEKYFEKKDVKKETRALCHAMARFSDALALCRFDKIITLVREVHEAICRAQETYRREREMESSKLEKSELLLGSLLPTIRNRFIPDTNIEKDTIIATIRWCVDRQMVQQALGLFRELVPRWVIMEGLISLKNETNKDAENWLKALSNVVGDEARTLVDRSKIDQEISDYFESKSLALVDKTINDELRQAFLFRNPGKYAKHEGATFDVARTAQLSAILVWFRYITLVRNFIMHVSEPDEKVFNFLCSYKDAFGEKRYLDNQSLASIQSDIYLALDPFDSRIADQYNAAILEAAIGQLAERATTVSEEVIEQTITSFREKASLEDPYIFVNEDNDVTESDYYIGIDKYELACTISKKTDALAFVDSVRILNSPENEKRRNKIKRNGGWRDLQWNDNVWEQLACKLVAASLDGKLAGNLTNSRLENNRSVIFFDSFWKYACCPSKKNYGLKNKQPHEEILPKLQSRFPGDFILEPVLKCTDPLPKTQHQARENDALAVDDEEWAKQAPASKKRLSPEKKLAQGFGTSFESHLNQEEIEKMRSLVENNQMPEQLSRCCGRRIAMNDRNVLALYGFRSKQEFIYRTNKMREITGASELIAGLFRVFLDNTRLGIDAKWRENWRENDGRPLSWNGLPEDRDGIVVYEGGGNLCVLFQDKETYIAANKEFSRLVLMEAPCLGLIEACVPTTGDFKKDLADLHRAHDIAKNTGANTEFCNTLPYTQIDRKSFQPIVEKRPNDHEGIDELTAESAKKLDAYDEKSKKDEKWKTKGMYIDELVDDKGRDSLIAVIYCDGNSIGNKLKDLATVADMREFAATIHEALVKKPLKAIHTALNERYENDPARTQFRTVIDHGDEITIVANAHIALDIVEAYFKTVKESGYTACAGIAVCHSHDPFSEVYKIAEECCESGKKKNRSAIIDGKDEASYFDFHFCRSGITGTLDQIRGAQEAAHTARPYAYASPDVLDLGDFKEAGRLLLNSKISRGDIKNLGNLILNAPARQERDSRFEQERNSRFELEIERLKAKEEGANNLELVKQLAKAKKSDFRRLLFDVSSFYDVWFNG